ncbi:hypothetical protein SAMN02745174_01807 [Cetobacterium ceti]|uniref:Uncharacterized protein n=1 Tax=Cetobacterium ceti TaxID=180163 RepID=A0A1T4P792_9FUSO|nr:hypothetical protein [Cetobacterium ceti]SJZ87413.1 hypothetical protein SAMN02745174_01807 [Cetobacterium ceti]
MKKIALLLGSMVILAGTAQAAEKEVTPVTVIEDNTLIVAPVVNEMPKFRVTSITTGIWNENRSGKANGNIGSNNLRFYANFAYGDNWTGYLQTRRYFDSNTKSSYNDGKKGIFIKKNTKNYVSVTRNNIYGNNSIGFTYEAGTAYDEYDLQYSFAPTDYISGYVIYGYGARSDQDPDYNYIEVQPRLSYKGWAMSYYFEGSYNVNSNKQGNYNFQQLRFFTPTYTYEKFSANVEWRTWLTASGKKEEKNVVTKNYEMGKNIKNPFDANRVYLKMNYALDNSTTVFTNLGYEIGKWESSSNSSKKSYKEFIEVGLNFKF